MCRTRKRGTNGNDLVLTRAQVAKRMDREAREHLGVPGPEALRMLDRGDLDGTVMQAELSMLRGMLDPK